MPGAFALLGWLRFVAIWQGRRFVWLCLACPVVAIWLSSSLFAFGSLLLLGLGFVAICFVWSLFRFGMALLGLGFVVTWLRFGFAWFRLGYVLAGLRLCFVGAWSFTIWPALYLALSWRKSFLFRFTCAFVLFGKKFWKSACTSPPTVTQCSQQPSHRKR